MERPPTLRLVHPLDPWAPKTGGAETFARDLLARTPTSVRVEYVGISQAEAERPVGTWSVQSFAGREVSFLPVSSVRDQSAPTRIPMVVRFMGGLVRYRRLLPAPGRVVLTSRPEPLLVLPRIAGTLAVVLHNETAAFRTGATEVRWRHAPRLYEALERRVLPRCDRIWVVRRDAAESYRHRFPELASRIEFLPSWYDERVFGSEEPAAGMRRELLRSLPGCTRIVLWAGRLEHSKDPVRAVEVLSHLADEWGMVLLGEGTLRQAVLQAAAARGIAARLALRPFASPVSLARMLRASDVYLLTSRSESMPRTVIEALASGTPVASPDVGEVPLVIGDGSCGRIVAGGDPEALARAVEDLAVHRPDRADCHRAAAPYSAGEAVERILSDLGLR